MSEKLAQPFWKSASPGAPTACSASDAAIFGFGYVPARSPPAAPLGAALSAAVACAALVAVVAVVAVVARAAMGHAA